MQGQKIVCDKHHGVVLPSARSAPNCAFFLYLSYRYRFIVSLSLLKNNYRYRFIAIAVNFLKNFIVYRLSLSQTFLIVLSLSQVRKLVIAESTGEFVGIRILAKGCVRLI